MNQNQEIEARLMRDIDKAVASLNRTMDIVKRQYPNARWFLASGSLYLLSEDRNPEANADRGEHIMYAARLTYSDGGDW